ncbi:MULTISPECIES: type II secretion system F family protein [Asaia]|uniref:Type II secretion system F family protein n=1 Tax=Asaia spathodeae TaxID=657016 RepID=A0ABX2P857_9PROT|nr:type II secretion system F family protein [Asaia spathodeae]
MFEMYIKRLRRTYRYATARVVERAHYEMAFDGRKLAAALRPVIPNDEYAILHAGEIGGCLDTALELLLDMRARTRRIVNAVISMYATFVSYALMIFVTLYIVAQKAIVPLQTFAQATGQPPSTMKSILIAAADWTSGRGPMVAVGGALFCSVLMIASLTLLRGPLRVRLERFPPWSTYRAIQGYVWLSTYIILVRSGRPETKVLEEQAERASPWLRERLEAIAELMSEHARLLPVALEEAGYHFPSPDMIDDIGNAWIGASDAYDALLVKARLFAEEMEKSAVFWSQTFRGIGLLVMYGLALFIGMALNTFLPSNI